jgi:hypothetical protein
MTQHASSDFARRPHPTCKHANTHRLLWLRRCCKPPSSSNLYHRHPIIRHLELLFAFNSPLSHPSSRISDLSPYCGLTGRGNKGVRGSHLGSNSLCTHQTNIDTTTPQTHSSRNSFIFRRSLPHINPILAFPCPPSKFERDL